MATIELVELVVVVVLVWFWFGFGFGLVYWGLSRR